MNPQTKLFAGLVAGSLTLAACGGSESNATAKAVAAPVRTEGTVLVVKDTLLTSTFEASGIAEPMQQATVSTKLMGTVTAVLVKEGEAVRTGQVLVQIDARDLAAKANQVAASIADAEAMQQEAATHAARFAALYADSAATRAQYDAAQTGIARANAGLRAARAGAAELEAVRSYASVRAPFSGLVTMRFADAGTFAAPGAPLLTVQDVSSLRLSASAPVDIVRDLKRGQTITARVDGQPVTATIEGVVPAGAGNLFTINAIIANRANSYRAGSAVTLDLPLGTKSGIAVPLSALVRDGDLVGVIVRAKDGDDRRWIRIGTTTATHAEVTGGLTAGESIVVPSAPAASASSTPTGA